MSLRQAEKYLDGEGTRHAAESVWSFDDMDDTDEVPDDLKDYIDAFQGKNPFADKLWEALERRGFSGRREDINGAVSFILDRCKDAGVNGLSRQTLKNWIGQSEPSDSLQGRENVYKLCFALGMDARETGEFFLKGYLQRPFNYKEPHEAVYYFCLNTHRSYLEAEKLIKQIDGELEAPFEASEYRHTADIGRELQTLDTEKAVLTYMAEQRGAFLHKSHTAVNTINDLLRRSKSIANELYAKAQHEDEAVEKVDSNLGLLTEIYGRPARAVKSGTNVYSSLSNSDFPTLIRRNMLQDQQLSNILNGKGAYEAIRKAIILLKFYEFFAAAELNGSEGDLYGEFVSDLDTCLAECGYVQHYWKNPYDWMFCYCATQEDPLNTFRKLVECYAGPEAAD